MKKEILTLLCVCALALQFGGCLSQGESKAEGTATSSGTTAAFNGASRSTTDDTILVTSSDAITITDGALKIRHHGHHGPTTDGAITTDGSIRPERPTCGGITITDGAIRPRHHEGTTDGAITTDGSIRPERPTCGGISITDGAIRPGHHGETTPGAITTGGPFRPRH